MYYRFNKNCSAPSSLATRHSPLATRAGFTLVELMVAMALTMFIMVILSQAFATGVDVFSQLKAIGDMEENLRAASTALRADLAADHFEARRRLSDPDFYTNPPRQGFLRIAVAGIPVPEGADVYTLPSSRSTSCVLHLAARRRGNQRQDFFSAAVPAGSPLLTVSTNFFGQPPDALLRDNANTYTSQWAEVAYFLVQTGTTTTPNLVGTGGTPLYALYRVERVVVPDNSALNWPTGQVAATLQSSYLQMSWQVQPTTPPSLYFNSPHDLAKLTGGVAQNRSFYFTTAGNLAVPAGFTLDTSTATGQANALTSGGRGAALVIGNVVSFQVRVIRSSVPTVNAPARTILDNDFADLPAPGFDSASPGGTSPLISAVAVTIRVWDQKSQQARQITIMQDM